ncbi:hypothetical protein D3C71_1714130 [compost metagenome]
MEEVEQLCSQIAIMDKGKIIASGTKDELKSMISTGEKISIELFGKYEYLKDDFNSVDNVKSTDYENGMLVVRSKRGVNNLSNILDYLKEKNISYGKIYCELPTLNDVFLEITGKQLRD